MDGAAAHRGDDAGIMGGGGDEEWRQGWVEAGMKGEVWVGGYKSGLHHPDLYLLFSNYMKLLESWTLLTFNLILKPSSHQDEAQEMGGFT